MGHKGRLAVLVSVFLLSVCLFGCVQETALDSPETEEITEIQTASVIVQEDVTTAPVLPEETQEETQEEILIPRTPWYEMSRLIYHAGGEVGGFTYTNSKEAVEQTLARGDILLEIDFLFTSDGHLICLHEWQNLHGMTRPCTLDTFLSLKMYDRFTTITAEDVIGYMRTYPEMYLIIDTKEDDPVAVVAELLRLCDYDATVAERFVIQLYDAGVKAEMLKLYSFGEDNFLFTAYKFGASRISEIMELCRDEGITVITVPYGSWDKATVGQFTDGGFLVFEHTLNYTTMTDNALGRGVYGFYTDFLCESDLGFADEE